MKQRSKWWVSGSHERSDVELLMAVQLRLIFEHGLHCGLQKEGADELLQNWLHSAMELLELALKVELNVDEEFVLPLKMELLLDFELVTGLNDLELTFEFVLTDEPVRAAEVVLNFGHMLHLVTKTLLEIVLTSLVHKFG